MTYKIKDLKVASVKVISVRPDSLLTEATTKMTLYNFSQLPVMSSTRKLEGVISWKTIGVHKNFGSNKELVRDYMNTNFELVNLSDNLLKSVDKILENEFVFVKNEGGVITGIITIYDIALQFRHLSEPFIELQMIEKSIREFISNRINNDQLLVFFNKKNPHQKIQTTNDLTFGNYITILGDKDLWSQFNINLDQKTFIEKLDIIRRIRNDLMHFRVIELSNDNLTELRDVSKFFRLLARVAK
jgi:CBS domain-containing protein